MHEVESESDKEIFDSRSISVKEAGEAILTLETFIVGEAVLI